MAFSQHPTAVFSSPAPTNWCARFSFALIFDLWVLCVKLCCVNMCSSTEHRRYPSLTDDMKDFLGLFYQALECAY